MRELLSVPAYIRHGRPARDPEAPPDGRARWQNARSDAPSTHILFQPLTVTLRTFIVEDNATIRENLIGTLEELASIQALGWAESEADARAWLTRTKGGWDLAIIDLFLRQGSGLGVLEACRERGPRQRVVVLSNYATTDMRKRCSQLGADAVFDKSNEIDALIDYCMQQSASA